VNVIIGPDPRHRTVTKVERKKETFSDKGLKAEEMETLATTSSVTDYGLLSRQMWNEIDRIQRFLQRQAGDRASKTDWSTCKEHGGAARQSVWNP
jgi:hypothetical protein